MLVALGNLTAQRQFENTGEDYGFDKPILTAWITAGGETYAWTVLRNRRPTRPCF